MMLYSKNSKYNKLIWLLSNLTIQVCPDKKAANGKPYPKGLEEGDIGPTP